jgi:putative oxidoreductase
MLNRLLETIDRLFQAIGDPLLLAARLVIVPFYLPAGIDKIQNYASTAQMMESHGVPAFTLPLVILLEIGGSILIAAGFLTRLTALALAVFSVAADVIFNASATSTTGEYLYSAELTIVAAFLAFMAVGAGGWSVDALRQRAARR